MKVLLVNHFPLEGSGSGVYTVNVAKSLIKKGHEVCIIMPENTKAYKKYERIKLHPVYFYNDEYIDNQLLFNFPCFTTHPRSTNNFFDLKDEQLEDYINAFDKAIKEEIDDFKPDVIHVQHIWILSSIANKYNIPVVVTAHGTDIIGHEKSDKFHKYTNDAVLNCKQIICISEDNKKLVMKNFNDVEDKITLIKNGYDENVFYKKTYNKEEVLNKLHINENYNKIVCYAGKMTEIKGVDTILKAATIYEDKNILTLLAGNGELFDELKELSNKLNLKNVHFLGNLDHETLRMVYNIADVSLVPSRFEAFGLVAVEALACGTFVIASKVGGLPGIINDNVGRIIDIDDYKELSNNIQKILNKEIIYDSDYIAKYAYDNYAQTTLIDNLITVYKKVK